MEDSIVTREMFREFEMRNPVSSPIVDCYRSGRYEITADFEDGTRAIYNDMRKDFRFINDPRENKHLNEDQVRREFSIRLRNKMQERGISSQILAERCGLTTAMVSRYLTRKATPSLSTVVKLSRALRCPVYELTDM